MCLTATLLDSGGVESWNHKMFRIQGTVEIDTNFPHSPLPPRTTILQLWKWRLREGN